MEPDLKSLSVLIVEDEAVNCRLLREMLVKTGLPIQQCETATSLSAAIDLIQRVSFDVLLIDLNLPDSCGLEPLVALTVEQVNAACIVVTGEYDDRSRVEALSAGAQEYLVQGRFDVDTLARSIRYAIERKKAAIGQIGLIAELASVNKELEDFAYIVSHDLKAPLRGISTLAKWIAEDYSEKIGAEGKEQIRLLLSRVQRMHDLIEGILDYSRIGHIGEELQDINLQEFLPEIIDMLAPPANIRIEIESELPIVCGQKTRIQQLFQNLIGNAVNYSDKPLGQIGIRCIDEGDFWKFIISDNGPGIDSRHFERIFQIFQTTSEKNSPESTGVGLSVVKKIVEMYDGKVCVESEVGKGSRFIFTLKKQERKPQCATPGQYCS